MLRLPVVLLLFFLLHQTGMAQTNLVQDSFFDKITTSSFPENWQLETWLHSTTHGTLNVDNQIFHSGKTSLHLQATIADDVKALQSINVQPLTWYKLSLWIKTREIKTNNIGANISIKKSMDHSPDITGTKDWTYVVVFGKTDKSQTHLDLCLRLGFYGSLNSGEAWFDAVRVERVNAPPVGAVIMSLSPPATDPPLPQDVHLSFYIILLFVILFFFIIFWLSKHPKTELLLDKRPAWLKYALGFFLLIVIFFKCFAAAFTSGYPGDMGCFATWTKDLIHYGPLQFYRPGYFCDYPPGYLYILWLMGGLGASLSSPLGIFLLKLPALICDIALVFIFYFEAKKYLKVSEASFVAVLCLLTPLATLNSCFWGQVDSVLALFLILAIIKLENKSWYLASFFFALAVMIKPQAILLAPLALVAFLQIKNYRKILITLGIFCLTFALGVLPFALTHKLTWIFELYNSTLGSYDFSTVNAFNLYALMGWNWSPNKTPFLFITHGIFIWILFAGALIFAFILLLRSQNPGRFAFFGGLLFLIFFVLGPKVHERYLFIAPFLFLLSYIFHQEKRSLILFLGTTFTAFANISFVLYEAETKNNTAIPNGQIFVILISVINILLLICAFRTAWDSFVKNHTLSLKKKSVADEKLLLLPQGPLESVKKQHWIILAVIIGVYSLLALSNLGSTSAPQKAWIPKTNDVYAVFDFGKTETFSELTHYWGLGSGAYAVQWSQDKQDWSSPVLIVNDNRFAELRWRSINLQQTGRYIKIERISGDLELEELGFKKGEVFLPRPALLLQVSSPDTQTATALFDEQKTLSQTSTAFNGMYFDEVYFPRSGWETIRGIEASENTHPPLGKDLLGISISLFGMTPFAWRIFGVIAGILMLPFMFSITLTLTRKVLPAIAATLLLSFDFMHFTQTRIGTVDSFAVLFILGAYCFMLKYLELIPEKKNLKNAFLLQLLCGLFIGAAMATKWIGIYAGAGLVVLFFYGLWNKPGFWKKANVSWAFLAFIIIPLSIYLAAYIPYMSLPGKSIADIPAQQLEMWNYHSQLKATHPFSSNWYEWPLMTKPVWYYSGAQQVPPDSVLTIVNFGNPIIWYLGSLSFLFLLLLSLITFLKPSSKLPGQASTEKTRLLITALPIIFILAGGLAEYLPWAVIPRKLVFIYHYFASTPFIIMALVMSFEIVHIKFSPSPWAYRCLWILTGLAGVLFFLFLPVIGGFEVSRTWADMLKGIFPRIYY